MKFNLLTYPPVGFIGTVTELKRSYNWKFVRDALGIQSGSHEGIYLIKSITGTIKEITATTPIIFEGEQCWKINWKNDNQIQRKKDRNEETH